jgi:hypothetical protein
MPGFDGTGPQGQGSMTGRVRGVCNPNGDYNRPYTSRQSGNWAQSGPISGWNFGFLRGRLFGGGKSSNRGRGRGFGRRWF